MPVKIKHPPIPIILPSSKSHTNRALIIAALAEGVSFLRGYTSCDDTDAMKRALSAMGIRMTEEKYDKEQISLRVEGGFSRLKFPSGVSINIDNAGTAMRFLSTLMGVAASHNNASGECILTGSKRMQERPIGDLLLALSSLGISVKSVKGNGCPPIVIIASENRNAKIGGQARLFGEDSSQYLSSILLCAPYFDKDTEIEITGELTSKPYIDLTIAVMRAFGVEVENRGYRHFIIRTDKKYRAQDFELEPDASSASYFLAGAALLGRSVSFRGLMRESAQGDARFVKILKRMQNDCHCEWNNYGLVFNGGVCLEGITADLNAMPDMAPTIAVLAIFAKGKTHIKNIANLRIKESDRISAIVNEIKKFGVKVCEYSDGLEIFGNPKLRQTCKTITFCTYNDHRMAMSGAVAKLACPAIMIENQACVSKSFPDFWNEWGKMGVDYS